MPLSFDEVIPYLINEGMLTTENVVKQDVSVSSVSRRNQNFKVLCENVPSFLVKQANYTETIATIEYEGKIYSQLHELELGHPMIAFIPKFYKFDSSKQLLIIEMVKDATDLRDYHSAIEQFPTEVGKQIGNILGTVHNLKPISSLLENPTPDFSKWAFTIHRPLHGIMAGLSSANLALIKIIQQFSDLCRLIDDLGREWKGTSVVHNDIRWDNFLIVDKDPACIKLIDWECAGIGEPCWDVGGVFSEYIKFSINSIPITGETPPEQFMELARYQLKDMQPAICAFWESYVQTMGLDQQTAEEWLIRSVRFFGARLLQSAYEQVQPSTHLNGNIICLLQLAWNVLARPEEANHLLLGIPRRQIVI